jgi:hypothetical protein
MSGGKMKIAFSSIVFGGFLTAVLPDNFKILGLFMIAFGFIYGSHKLY